jgi:hypothetical protein
MFLFLYFFLLLTFNTIPIAADANKQHFEHLY